VSGDGSIEEAYRRRTSNTNYKVDLNFGGVRTPTTTTVAAPTRRHDFMMPC